MESVAIILLITFGLLIYGVIEYQRHQRFLKKIPVRIHVNGTRGKSSVTRLIGAGLRAGGKTTLTKVTGTFPRMILSDGREVEVPRKEKANILEQLKVVKFAAKEKVDVLLIECMALQPQYQKITEQQMVKSTHGVITNIRLDHLDVMGPGLKDVGKALSGTVPKRAMFFSAEDRMEDFLKTVCEKRKSTYVGLEEEVSKSDLEGFTYFEHAVNVSLALTLCKQLGVNREVALPAMHASIPDEGVLRRFKFKAEEGSGIFYNALAANDPESSLMIWNNIRNFEGEGKKLYMLLNNRKDRKSRSETLLDMLSQMEYDGLILTGENTVNVKLMAKQKGVSGDKILDLGMKSPQEQLEGLSSWAEEGAVVVAFGNMGAGGAELSKYIEKMNIND